MVNMIVCVDDNWGIGYKNNLLISIPEDMKFFKEMTTGNMVIMGRKTYDSLSVKPLPNRINVVITSNIGEDNYAELRKDCVLYANLDVIKETLSQNILPYDIYIIGGASIYNELLPYCDRVYTTEVEHSFENVDTYFPNLDELEDWHIAEIGEEKEYNGMHYRFCVYDRFYSYENEKMVIE